MIIRHTPSLLLALTLAACGGSDGTTDVGDNGDIAVHNSGADEVTAGGTLTFTATVTNEGPAAVGDVQLTHHLDGPGTVASITCSATGGAVCPATPGADMSVPSMPVGGGLVFTISVTTTADQIGAVTSALIATSEADDDTANNTGEATTIALDGRNGDYTVYGSNGRKYTLTLNFNQMTYEMSGQQMTRSGTFTRDADGVGYVFGGTARFRMAQDMVVGGFDFDLEGSEHPYDKGVRPIVGARVFSTDLAALAGKSFNLLGLNLRRNDMLESVVYPSTIANGELRSCRAPVPVRFDQCPENFRYVYALSVVGSEFKGTDATHKDVIHFRVARSGDTVVLLRAEDAADATGRHFRVGLAETAGLAGGTFGTSSTSSAWGATVLTDTRYSFSGTLTDGTASNFAAYLVPLTDVGPDGLRKGNRVAGDAPIYLGQNGGLVVMLGAADGGAEGQIDLGLR
ncbi:hypothetical protein AACH06_04965 [Ideonella sp. DXS29W]|uniref:DUF11 domain-containing protein n=1 Tax=Ideonella lacteola TaxID=2984193 RepID=A0ABU9BK87_9BURK